MPRSLTVGEVVTRLGLPAVVTGPDTARVETVRIVSELEELDGIFPDTAVVLAGAAANEPWRVDRAVRLAWERAAACIVVTEGDAHSSEARALAERLSIALIIIHASPLDTAVRVASIIAADEASEAGTLAAAARAFGVATASPRSVLATLRRLLPDLDFVFVDHAGARIAGSAEIAAESTAHGSAVLDLAVPFPSRKRPARLIAVARGSRSDQARTVETVGRLAVAPLTAWAALRRIAFGEETRAAAALLEELLSADGRPGVRLRSRLAALGWTLGERYRAVAVVSAAAQRSDALDAVVQGRIAQLSHTVRAAPYGDAWVALLPVREGAAGRASDDAVRTLAEPDRRVPGIAVGVSAVRAADDPLTTALDEAIRTARVAVAAGERLLFGEDLDPAMALPALLGQEPLQAARALLDPLLDADRDGTLLETLVATLDHSDRPAQAASVLGVHRNTVTARLERIRAIGIDPANPQHRLAIHVAARRMIDDRRRGQAAP